MGDASHTPRRTAAIILAAGASTRLGNPKQLVRLQIGSETLLERALRVARAAGCSPAVIVLGAKAAEIQAACDLTGSLIVINERWQEGMSASLRKGVELLPGDTDAVVVMTCDQPAVTVAHLCRLIEDTETWGEPVCSSYAGRRGVPACFPASSFVHLRMLRGDAGARSLLADARALDLPDGELDIDTADALAKARRRLG